MKTTINGVDCYGTLNGASNVEVISNITKGAKMKIAIFNPEARRWADQAYALVNDDEQAREICLKNGYSSLQLWDIGEYDTPAGKLYLNSIPDLTPESV